MQRLVFMMLFLSLVIHAQGQQGYFQEDEDSLQFDSPELAIKIIPSQLLWRFPSYAIGLEHRLKSNLSLDYTFGIIQDKNVFNDDEIYFDNKSGFKSSIMLKSYQVDFGAIGSLFNFLNGPGDEVNFRHYVGFEILYNNINFERTRTFSFDCENNCEYFERATYGVRREEVGLRLNVGFMAELVGPVSLEIAWALGMVRQSYSTDNLKPVGYTRAYGTFYEENTSRVAPSLNFNIKLSVDLK